MNGFRHVLKGIVVVIFLNCICFAGITAASSNPEFYYYSGNRKNALNVSTTKVAIRFKENTGLEKREQVVNAHANLEPFSKRQEISKFKLTLISVREGKTKEKVIQAVNSLKNKSEVEIATPVFDMQDAELMVTDEFIVKFNPSVPQEEIDAFNDLNGVEIVRKPKWTDRYTLKSKDPKSKSIFEIANLYYENPITIFSMPNFIRKTEPLSTTPDDTYFSDQWHLDNAERVIS